jgi:hypothetical protein
LERWRPAGWLGGVSPPLIAASKLNRAVSFLPPPVHLQKHVPHRAASEPNHEDQYGNDGDDDEQRVSFLIHS